MTHVNYTFHWHQAFQALPAMLGGALVTIEIAVLSMVIGDGLRCRAGARAQLRNRLARGFATVWVETARNTPALFQIYMVYFGLGSLGIFVDSFPALLVGIAFNNAGYLAETFRGGLRAIPPTQVRAARSLGMSAPQAFRLIVMPQMFRTVFQPMTNQMVWAILMTSLGVVVGINTDLAGVTQELNVRTFRTFEFFAMAAVIYYLITKVVTLSAPAPGRATVPVLRVPRCSRPHFALQRPVVPAAGRGHDPGVTFWRCWVGTLLGFVFGVLRAVAPCVDQCAAGRRARRLPLGPAADPARPRQLVQVDRSASTCPRFTVACVVLALYTSAYCAEIVRAGVLAVPSTTRRAARSLGLTWWQDMAYIVFPIALRVSLPSWIGLTLGVMKDTALVLWIGDRRAAARVADPRHPHPGAAVRADDLRADLLPDELPDLALRRVP